MTMHQPLFHYPEEFIEKTAGEVDLPDDPNQWAQSILQELYKQVPYITEYQPHVQMQRVDAEQGYGIGNVEIQNQTEAPMGADPSMMESAGIRTVRIPFIIRDRKLSPFDLLVNDTSKVIPLTENRLRQALFRAQAFDVTSRTPGDQSMIGQLYPPYRQNYGFGGGGIAMNAQSGMGIGKIGSALESFLTTGSKEPEAPKNRLMDKIAMHSVHVGNESLLSAILPTITSADHSRFMDEISKEASYLFKCSNLSCSGFQEILSKILDTEPGQIKEGSWRSWYPPSVVQVRYTPQGYQVKTASHNMWDPEVDLIDRGELVRRYGVKLAMDVDTSGAITMASGDGVVGQEQHEELLPVEDPGLYKVKDIQGQEHIGFVIPQLIDIDGSPVPLALFTNGTTAAIQSEIYGVHSGDGVNLPSGPIGKSGSFYSVTPNGLQMTIPFEFSDSYTFGGQPQVYSGQTYDGRPIEVSPQPNVSTVVPVDSNRILVPADWQWLPLDGAQAVSLVGEEEADSMQVEDKQACVQVRGDGSSFSFSGVPVTKLAQGNLRWLNLDDAMFLLAGLGVDQAHGVQKLAEAAAHSDVRDIRVGRVIELADEQVKAAMTVARNVVETLSELKQPILLKEAATMSDPSTVDTVLSLGFINPENVLTFVSYLPDLEDTQSKLCEILLGVRLGLKSLPQASLERVVRSLEETIEGLKVLGFQGS